MVGSSIVFHICTKNEWKAAKADGIYKGSTQDIADGFIHCSTAEQLIKSAAKHRAGQRGLVLLSVETDSLSEVLRWEPSREEALFPHLYGPLPLAAVIRVDGLAVGSDGRHLFPSRLGA